VQDVNLPAVLSPIHLANIAIFAAEHTPIGSGRPKSLAGVFKEIIGGNMLEPRALEAKI
jgi:hypothetical protein